MVLTRLATKDDAADATPKGNNNDKESLMLSPKVNVTTAIAAMRPGKKSPAPTDILTPKIAQSLRRLTMLANAELWLYHFREDLFCDEGSSLHNWVDDSFAIWVALYQAMHLVILLPSMVCMK